MPLAAGARLGPYEILDLVGAGGMGEVYRARDPRLGRDVAVKVLPAEVGADPERLRRFEQEARAVAALNHPNILTVFDIGTHEGTPYVVMELLQGETLREMTSRRAPTQRQVLSFLVQAAQGLEAAHAKGIVHRDVKPENVFVTTDGRVKVLDFGLAKVAARLTSESGEATESSPTDAGLVVGTVGYMSPEQVRGLAVDPRTDVFSFGVVLYELLGGKHPFRRETTVGDADGDPGGDAGGAVDGGAGDSAGGVGDRASVPGEGAGGEVRLGARRAGGAGGRPGGAGGVGGASGGGGAEPVPGPRELHGEGRGPLLRPGGRDQGPLAAPAEPQAPGGDRPLGDGQDVLRARGCRSRPARGLGRRRARRRGRARPWGSPRR